MNSRLDGLMQRAGPPAQIIIYKGADRTWRFAIYHTREIADGHLDTAPAATPEAARAAAKAMVQEICQRFYHCASRIVWQPADDKKRSAAR